MAEPVRGYILYMRFKRISAGICAAAAVCCMAGVCSAQVVNDAEGNVGGVQITAQNDTNGTNVTETAANEVSSVSGSKVSARHDDPNASLYVCIAGGVVVVVAVVAILAKKRK